MSRLFAMVALGVTTIFIAAGVVAGVVEVASAVSRALDGI